MNVKKVFIPSSADRTFQDAFFCRAEVKGPRPLLVGLHTWSMCFRDGFEQYRDVCEKLGWDLVYPNFRGPNWTRQAMGSHYVVTDLMDARQYAIDHSDIDPERIYLAGGSGGGHCSLMMAGRTPGAWAGISSWCPISDLQAWHDQCMDKPGNQAYALEIEAAAGGNPGQELVARLRCEERSPLTWLHAATNQVTLDISSGIHDGHRGSVPISHALHAFNAVAAPEDRIAEEDIRTMTETETIPSHLRWEGTDPSYGKYTVLLRRVSGRVRLNIFEGAHDIVLPAAMAFLDKCRLNQPPDWSPRQPVLPFDNSELGK